MIETDKYEGHIAGPWVYEEESPHGVGAWEADVLIPAPYNDTKEYPNGRPCRVLSSAYYLYHLDRADLKLIADAPIILEELKRAYQLIVDAAWQLHWNVGTIAASDPMSSKEWDENIHAPAQAWRRQVQDILDASEEGCPWKESEGE